MVRSFASNKSKFLTIDKKSLLMGRGKEMYMTDIVKVAKNEIVKVEQMIKKIDMFLATAPDGCLKWQNKAGKIYYYHQYMLEVQKEKKKEEDKEKSNDNKKEENKGKSDDKNNDSKSDKKKDESTDKWKRDYIKKNSSLAESLAQKHYYITIKPILEKNLNELKRFIKKYQKEKADNVYELLSTERKKLVTPLQTSVKEQIKRWWEETYEKNNMYPENLRYETEQGELVRSKSEVIIANILYQHRKDILYKYERPFTLMIDGKMKTIYPDFTIINVYTGKVIYWEHAGRMDDPHYAGEFVKKMNAYIANDLSLGKDVILTFETQGNPLDIGIVKQLVESII